MSQTPRAGRAGRAGRGFTLLEVMLGLALLGLGLTVLIKSAANSIFSARQAHMMGVVTDLSRGKMYEIEEILLKDGFSDTEVHEDDKTFEEEGWPGVHYSFKVEEVELPGWEQLQALSKSHAEAGSAAGSGGGSGGKGALTDPLGSGAGGEELGGFANSALGGMLSQFGGFGGGAAGGAGGDIDAAQGGAFV
ncbi:MAG: prepilin-type N-terminal cleavage/methylation domain-containing protein, partial [Myxococcales bacterium]|nr:prepilin-type N-terminal cleavage/methylation domain-containing protein [Myxococcales bacterium]